MIADNLGPYIMNAVDVVQGVTRVMNPGISEDRRSVHLRTMPLELSVVNNCPIVMFICTVYTGHWKL